MTGSETTLIAEFAARRSEAAFAALVRQHVNLVFATAWRQVGDYGAAEEITQNVFVALAQAAGKLGQHPTIAGWLYQTTLNKSREWLRAELRHRRREQVAVDRAQIHGAGDSVWAALVPLLDEALLQLREPDRQAVILHFLEGQTFSEVGATLGVGEDAARKRVGRCLDQLTQFFRQHGFTTPALTAGAPLLALATANAPAGLSATVTAAGLAAVHSAASTSTVTLIKGALKLMAWSKAKTAIVAGVVAVLAVGTTAVVVKKVIHPYPWADDPGNWELNSEVLGRLPADAFIFRPTRFPRAGGGIWAGGRMLLRNESVRDLVDNAYGASYVRTLFPDNMPDQKFDLVFTGAANGNELIKKELRRRFQLTARREYREMDVLLLKVQNRNPPNLSPSRGGNSDTSWIGGDQSATLKNLELSGLFGNVESFLGVPVLDETGYKGRYNVDFNWKPKPGESKQDAYKRALSEQLGLVLVPARESIEVLVVEHTDK